MKIGTVLHVKTVQKIVRKRNVLPLKLYLISRQFSEPQYLPAPLMADDTVARASTHRNNIVCIPLKITVFLTRHTTAIMP